jgi:hypothetical protein
MSKLPSSLARIAVVAAVMLTPASARAETSLVAVAPFTGPEAVAREARAVVVEVAGSHYRLVPLAELERARALSDTDGSEPSAALTIARLTGADAVVVGRVAVSGDSYALSLSVLRASSGESVGAVLVPLADAEMTPAARDRIARLLGNLLAWIDPRTASNAAVRERPAAPAAPEAREAPAAPEPPAAPAQVTAGTAAPGATASVRVKRAAARPEPERHLPFAFEAALGLSATARRLGFTQQPGLASASLSSNPSPGLRFEAEAATIGEPGIALAVSIDRSIGAEVAMGGSSGIQLPLSQNQWGLALRGRMRYRKRWVPTISLGYNEIKYEVDLRPPDLLIPDARYAYIDVGAGVRAELGAVSVFGGLRYLHAMATSGITDVMSFGAASTRGLAGDLGADLEVTKRILLRAGVRYLRFVHDFDGSGDLAVALDADLDQDVTGAIDSFLSGYAQAVFRF